MACVTETDRFGMSPLKQAVLSPNTRGVAGVHQSEVIVAAALYDETAEQQLTTELFEGVGATNRDMMRTNMLKVFGEALNTSQFETTAGHHRDGTCLWDQPQQNRIRGFIDLVEALNP